MADFETDVVLSADGDPVERAIASIEARIKGIQQSVTKVMELSRAAGEAFGGSLQKQMADFNKMVGTLERFQNNILKNDPHTAFNAIDADAEKKKMADMERGFAVIARDREKTDNEIRQRQEKLDEERIRRTQAAQLAADRETDQLRSANRLKYNRETMRAEVEDARTIQDLDNQRIAASTRIAAARGQIGKVTQQEERQLYEIISVERERLNLANARIKAETLAATSKTADLAELQLGQRAARAAEQELLATTNLGTARARQAELVTSIATRIEQIRGLTGKERVEAEQLLKIDQARLAVADKRVLQLENENRKLIQMAQPKPGTVGPPLPPGVSSPGTPAGPRSGPGLFGATGIGGIVARTAAYGAAASAIYGVMNAARSGVEYTLQFQDAIQKLGAISGATGTQMAELSKTISDIAANSRFATLDLVEAATVLAQAGFTQGDIGRSLKSISELATAAGVGIKDATDVITSAIGSFQLQAGEASHIGDVLAVALNRTKLNLQQVALGIQYAGQTAHDQNISFEELTATMAVMAQAGIRSGSTIGTGLRQFLTDLQNPTKKLAEKMKELGISMQDIDVKHLGLPEVLNRLAAAGFDAAAAYGSLEKRGAAAYLVLRNNRDAINEEILAQNQIGAAAQAAAKGQDSLTAEWQRFKNVLDSGIEERLHGVTNGLKEYLRTINDAAGDEEIQRLQKLYDNTGYFDFAAQDRIKLAMAEHLDQVRDLSDAEAENADEIEATTTAINQATDEYNKHTQTLNSVDDATARVYVRAKELKNSQTALAAETSTLIARFDGLAKYLDGAALSFDGLTSALHAYRLEELKLQGQALATIVAQQRESKGEHFATANNLVAAARGDGILSSLPANIQRMMQYVAAHANDTTALTTLSNAGEKLGDAAGRRFVEKWVSAVQQGVGANTQAQLAQKQLDIVGHLTTAKGVDLQNMVSSLAGQPDSVIKAAIGKLTGDMKGKSQSVQGAYLQLIAEAQSYIGSGNSPQAPPSKTRHNNRAEREQERRDRTMTALSLKADQAQLTQAIKGLLDVGGFVNPNDNGNIVIGSNRSLTTDQFKKNLERVNDALNAWIADRTDQVQQQIKDQKMSPAEAKAMLDDLAREIAAKREEAQRDVGEAIAKALDVMVKAIEDVAARAEEAANHQLNLANARVTALGRADLQGKVPDFVQATYERAAARAKDDRDRQQIAIQEAELASLRQKAADVGGLLDAAGGAGLLGKDDPGVQKLKDLNFQITQLQNNTDELKASLGGEGLLPQSFSANLQMAIENYKQVNQLTASWGQMISMNLTDAFGTAQGAMTQFFSDMMSGTVTMRSAFANMVKAVIGYLQQLLAKMLAVKLMEMALSIFGGSAGVSSTPGYSQLAASHDSSVLAGLGFAVPHLYGGEVHALSGRYISDGVPNRDTVPARIAKGEYVVRKRAVDSVGVEFMNQLNERGAMALKALQPTVIMPPPAQQSMNVYVVAKDEQPSLGPNDVLVTIANDIYRGGTTKQLIKQVVQGG